MQHLRLIREVARNKIRVGVGCVEVWILGVSIDFGYTSMQLLAFIIGMNSFGGLIRETP